MRRFETTRSSGENSGLTSRVANGPSPVIFAAMLASASLVGLLIIVSPYVFTFHDSGAIRISAWLSPGEAGPNQTVKVTVSAVNGLGFPNELPESNDFKVQNMSSGPCGGLYPLGIAVFHGRYGLDNVSSAKAVEVFDGFSIYFCPGLASTRYFTFGPHQNVTRQVDLEGYWTAGETQHPAGGVSEGVLHPFPPGEYTLVVGDEWGHIATLYFTVT